MSCTLCRVYTSATCCAQQAARNTLRATKLLVTRNKLRVARNLMRVTRIKLRVARNKHQVARSLLRAACCAGVNAALEIDSMVLVKYRTFCMVKRNFEIISIGPTGAVQVGGQRAPTQAPSRLQRAAPG